MPNMWQRYDAQLSSVHDTSMDVFLDETEVYTTTSFEDLFNGFSWWGISKIHNGHDVSCTRTSHGP